MVPLHRRRCVACRPGTEPLAAEAISALHAEVPDWTLVEGRRLERRFEFQDFRAAMEFVNRVAEIAEEEQHHPDIAIHWNKVDLSLWTHAIGGLHENDFILAARIDRLLEPAGEAANPAG